LLSSLGKTKADDEPLTILEILKRNGLSVAIWCLRAVKGHDKEIRLFAVWCAQQTQHLMTDPRTNVRESAEAAARAALRDAAWAAAEDASLAAARAASYAAAWATPWDAAFASAEAAAQEDARDAARSAQENELIRICNAIEAEQAAQSNGAVI